MFLNFGLVVDAVLFSLGVYWCYIVLGRWLSDLEELREVKDGYRRAGVLFIWAVTIVIAIFVVNFAVAVVTNIVNGIKSLS